MILYILAAGKGTRLFPLTKNIPKVLIDFGNGETLIDSQIQNAINSSFIDEVRVITGYLHTKIEDYIQRYSSKIKISTIYNPFFDISNNLLSLWLVNSMMRNEDFIITNGDNMYDLNVFDRIQNNQNEIIQVTIDYKDAYDEDDMKVSFDSNGKITRIHKEIDLADSKAESVGLCIVKGEKTRTLFADKLIELAMRPSFRNKYWLEVFNELIHDGQEIKFIEIEKDCWREMDFHPDVEEIKRMILNSKK